MAQVAITADIHFGVPGRLSDLLWSVKVIREYCHRAGVDVVFICGDLFHDRQSIAIDVLAHVIDFFEETRQEYNQNWIVFPGNHDMFLRHSWNINSLSILRNYLTVIDDIKAVKVDDRRFIILPFITYELAYLKVLSKIHRKIYEDGDVLLTHIGVSQATLNTCFMLKHWSLINFYNSRFHRIYTGHFHSKQEINEHVYYPGSPIPFKFDEGDVPHGFYVYDTTADTHRFINIWKAGAKFFPEEKPPPQFYTIPEENIKDLIPNDVHNGIVRVAIQSDRTREEKRIIKESLLQLGAQSVRILDLTQKVESKPNIASAPSKDLFKTWVEQDDKGVKDLNLTLLHKLNNEIINEGDERYSVEESDI
jgi:DNA repair exonuclease SbcCD nuclease subunit